MAPPWPSPGLQGLRSDSLDLRESGLDQFSTNKLLATSKKSHLDILLPKFASDGLEAIIKKIDLEILHTLSLVACQMELVVQLYGHVKLFHPNAAVKTAIYGHICSGHVTNLL